MNEIRIKKDEILSITKTDVIKVLLREKKENGKNKIILCDLEYGLRQCDNDNNYIIGKLSIKKVPEYKICNYYKNGKYWTISIDVFGYYNYEIEKRHDINNLYKKISYLYYKFYLAGYTKPLQNKDFNNWFINLINDNSLISSAPLGYTIGYNFCYFTVSKKDYINEVKDALLKTYCEFFNVEGWC